jgi:hypothetical protein
VARIDGYEIRAVRGEIDDELAERLVAFWTGHGALDETGARARLGSVVCVLTDAAGEISGVNSAIEDEVGLIGGRRFWVYRSFLLPGVGPEVAEAMIDAARAALEDGFDPAAGGPVGLYAAISDRALMRARPEAIWPGSQMLYAGYTSEGHQVRIRYFEGAVIGPGMS